ncbi:MAG: YdbH domain-containing protein [Opitutaceae bacterium]|nr:YdbH domain-containing protein [Opitutaceae bacterium]
MFARRNWSRILFWLGVGAALGALAAYGARATLTDWALRTALRSAGAEDIRLDVRAVSLWQIVINDVGLRFQRQPLAAGQVSVVRPHWWTPTLGRVSVAGLRVPVDVAALNPMSADEPLPATATVATARLPASVPAEEVSIDGQLVVQAPGIEQALTVKLDATMQPEGQWVGQMTADGPGLAVRVDADYRPSSQELSFRIPIAHFELQHWQDFLGRVVPVAGKGWSIDGQIDGTAEGTLAPGKSAAAAAVKLRGGAFSNSSQTTMAKGVEADVVFTDLTQLRTAPGQTLHVAEMRAGRVALNDFDMQFEVQGRSRIDVTRLALQMMGGRLAAEPFSYSPARGEFDATVVAESLAIEEVLALAPDVPAQAAGRINGRLPVRIGAGGIHLGTGWFGLAPGVAAEVQFNAKGLLTRGLSPGNPSYAVLSKIEGGILRLRLDELRLDVYPADAPPGQSARLHMAGTPVDESVRAPVSLDVNINGPVERLLNLGFDSRVEVGTARP